MRRAAITALALGALVSATSAASASATTLVKLPKKITTPTGNFITLYAYDAPSSKSPVASVEVQVCTSAHTPKGTGVDPAFFTLKLTSGSSLTMAAKSAHSPQLPAQPLGPSQCGTKGWISFDVPSGKTVEELQYEYNGLISWAL
ncbi:MAG: hypothetical protein ABSC56_13110 [Solirubrobacteraceae bacterium]|jgi:hypothetical protein